ncbi:vanadium-dependent haloperoxidase [Streptomyces sp. NPDC052676]|uniref:vanadium-dependent haloperoxidase n=1 Tax=Streptomyces sp. NPDC052676 TaxID=3154953 RepID=UPI0034438F88
MSLPSHSVAATPRAEVAVDRDHVIYWNKILQRTFRQLTGPSAAPTELARASAIVHVAIYDAANSAKCVRPVGCLGQPYLTKVPLAAGTTPDVDTAIDYAAFRALRSVWPDLDFSADLTAAQAAVPSTVTDSSRTAGADVGTQAAEAVIRARAGDGAAEVITYPGSTQPGFWRPTGSGAAVTPHWGRVKPFALPTVDQVRPGLPAGKTSMPELLASPEYAAQVDEVRRLGGTASTARTPDQTQAAFFWANDLDGTYKPIGQIFANTQTLVAQEKIQTSGTAKLFAMLSLALADAGIAAWHAKYETPVDLWRPESAINLDDDGNAATVADPSWRPLSANRSGQSFSPPFPAYVSGHATFAGAWAKVMSYWFGQDRMTFDAGTEDPHAQGVIRRFDSFSAAARENALARLWLGVHYRWDAEQGLATGEKVGDHVSANHLGPNSAADWVSFGTAYNKDTCPAQGQKLIDEHRWTQYKCEVLADGATFRLSVK